jgi:hypothetical protein
VIEPSPPIGSVSWLRKNITLLMALVSLLSMITGGIVAGTARLDRYDSRMDTDERARVVLAEHFDEFNKTQKEDRKELELRRQKLAADLAALDERVAILEQSIKQLGPMGSHTDAVDLQLQAINTRTAVVETQIHFIVDYLQNFTGMPKGGGLRK